MFNWIKNLFLSKKKTKLVSTTISIVLDGKTIQVLALKTIGNMIQCSIPHQGGYREYLVREYQAVDREHFQQLVAQFDSENPNI